MTDLVIPPRWGICFAGNERAFCEAILTALHPHPTEKFHYLEIGLGPADTFVSVATLLESVRAKYHCTGVDVPGYPAGELRRSFPFACKCTIFADGSKQFLADNGQVFNFAFIDGCHCRECVVHDFVGVEPWIASGGIVAFHDSDIDCQGQHIQPHSGRGIEVRQAIAELRLLDGNRPGWSRIGETTGDKHRGGHGCFFVQRQ